jgi:hypothetical protein
MAQIGSSQSAGETCDAAIEPIMVDAKDLYKSWGLEREDEEQ